MEKLNKKDQEIKCKENIELYEKVIEQCKNMYCETLAIDDVDIETNFFNLGGDSLTMIKLMADIEEIYNINISFEDFIEHASIKEIAIKIVSELNNNSIEKGKKSSPYNDVDFEIETNKKFESFALSELQESYFVGRKSEEEYDGIATNAYMELSCNCYEHSRFIRIMNRLIERHDMLRCAIDKDGVQRVKKEITDYNIEVLDLSDMDPEKQEEKLVLVRKDMLNMKINLENPPLLITKVSKLNSDSAVIHFYVDGMIMDGWSYEVFHGELETLYQDENIELPEIGVSYRDYVLFKKAFKKSKKYIDDKEYWLKRIEDLPQAGLLPLKNEMKDLEGIVGEQIKCSLCIEEWNAIEKKAQKYGVTPFSVLFTSFALVIARWNYKQRFMLNIPEFDRPEFHPDVKKILGICSAFLLFVVDNSEKQSFLSMVNKTKKHLVELIEHHGFSGIEILREIYKRDSDFNNALVPIVFGMTPNLPHIGKRLMKMRYQENHTSQIWIDINTVIYDEFIEFNWNCVKGLIDTRMICDMVEIQKDILRRAAYEDGFWENNLEIEMPEYDSKIIANSNNTFKPFDFICMGDILESSFIKNKDRKCLISDEKTYTYQEIHELVKSFATTLINTGCKQGDNIAVYMDKSVEQILSVLAVNYIGAVYVPIEYDSPEQLILKCVNNINAKTIIVSDEKIGITGNSYIVEILPKISKMKEISIDKPVQTSEDSLIAIIHTSGSTGIPKAVMVGQKGLLNSLYFTSEKFEVGQDDACIALTNLAHDMAMYDIFGMLMAGGSVAVLKAESTKDPKYWLEIMKNNKITVWNSVPAMLQMLFEVADKQDIEALQHLRVVISGGDYLHPNLAEKIKNVNDKVRLINVGGPTETTLWNIYHEVTFEEIKNQVIPYGRPIYNTKYYVLNEKLEQVPVGVTGMMYCAGVGVTKGYMGDPNTTAAKYIVYEPTGERIYNTGDLGKYNEDGEIIFMGREDFQVKINGKRIELNGISTALRNVEGIINCAVKYNEQKQFLTAYYVSEEEVDDYYLRTKLLEVLPIYMLPKYFIKLDSIPLTNNGKIDWKSLPEESYNEKNNEGNIEPGSEIERKIVGICSEILNQPVYLNSDFFTLGGNSILMIRLLSRIRECYSIDISLTELFSTSSISEWCTMIGNKVMEKEKIVHNIKGNKWIFHGINHDKAKINLMCFPHAGGSAMYFTPFGKYFDNSINMWPVQYPFRENRQSEKMPTSLKELAHNMVIEGKELFEKPFALFGHCTGSIIAYEVARQVKEIYNKEPELLVVSANVSPRFSVLGPTSDLSDKEFVQILSDYGFIDKKMFENEEFSSYFLPIMRKDFDLHEEYDCGDITKLSCPIYTLCGTSDLSIPDYNRVLDWENFTTDITKHKKFEGGHFYLDNYRNEICSDFQSMINKKL